MDHTKPAQWFRMYAEFATDPKVQMLSEADQRRYLMLLCLRCSNGYVTLQDEAIAFQLRISESDWASTKAALIAKNLILDDNQPTAWDKRQKASDSSAARVAKHRALHKGARNCDVTLQQRPVEIEKEIEKDKNKNPTPEKPARFDPLKISLPECVNPETWAEWIAYRRERKLTTRQQTMQAQLDELATWAKAGHDPAFVIRTSIAKGWQGLFEPKVQARASPYESEKDRGRREVFEVLCGGKQDEPVANERDITGIAERVG